MRRLLTTLSRLLSDFATRLRRARRAPPPPGKPAGGSRPRPAKQPPYDLAKDASTDNQKYLM